MRKDIDKPIQSGKCKALSSCFFKGIWRKICNDPKGIIYLIMITVMFVATGAVWLLQFNLNRDNIITAFYALSILLSLVFKYTLFFKRKYMLVVIISILSLMYIVYLLY